MGTCDGVLVAAGVPGLEDGAVSPLTGALTFSMGSVVEVAGDSLAGESFGGDSSLAGVAAGSRRFRSLSGDTLSVTSDILAADLRRSFSFVVVADFVGGGIIAELM